MNRRTVIVIVVLAVLAVVPVTLSFLFSGENEDEVRATPDVETASADVSVGAGARSSAGRKAPVFKGFEGARYQQYDALISKYVAEFNRDRAKWMGSTPGQADSVPELTSAQVKAHMIQETGGNDMRSRAAWARDPLQVNVPGDWNPYKKYLGIREPRRRNEGSLEKNLRAGIMLLARKGFGVSGQPAANRPEGGFDGWRAALQRYNGRSDKTADGRPYRDAYAERILRRAKDGSRETPIPIPTKSKR